MRINHIKSSKTKPKYNMWQNSAWMVSNAWRICKSVLFLVLASALVSVAQTTSQMLIAPVILDKVETAAPLSELLGTIAVFAVLLALLAAVSGYISENTCFGRIQIRMILDDQIHRKCTATSFPNLLDTAFIRAKQKADKATSSDWSAAEDIWKVWDKILTSVIGFLIYLAMLSSLNPLLLILVVVTAVIGYYVNKKIQNWEYEHKDESAACEKQMDYIDNKAASRTPAKDIRIFGLQSWLTDVWNSAYRLFRAYTVRRERHRLWMYFSDTLLSLIRNGAAYAYLISLALTNDLSASEFLLYFNAFSGFTEWIKMILEQFGKLNEQSIDLTMLREFLEWPEPFRFEGGKPLPSVETRSSSHRRTSSDQSDCAQSHTSGRNSSAAPACFSGFELTLEHVSYRYPEAEEDTIKQIDLTVHPGEKLAIVGRNGAGKTTLIRLLCGFLDPTEGRVLLNGEDIRQYNRKDYYQLFSTVFQDYSVIDATIKQNVAQQYDEIDEEKVSECLQKAGLMEKIQSLPNGLGTQIGRFLYDDGIELSGGETQRLMLARALYKDAPILVLDEPTAALDPIAENDIYMKYSEMTDGCTSLFISHRLASTRFCDRIIYMEHGQITEEGTHESLLATKGGYAELFEVQSQYYADEVDKDDHSQLNSTVNGGEENGR